MKGDSETLIYLVGDSKARQPSKDELLVKPEND